MTLFSPLYPFSSVCMGIHSLPSHQTQPTSSTMNPIANVSWMKSLHGLIINKIAYHDSRYDGMFPIQGLSINVADLNRRPSLFPPNANSNFVLTEGSAANNAVNGSKGGKNGVGMKFQKNQKEYAYPPSDSENEKKRKSKAKKAFIKSHTDIQKVKAGKIVLGKTKNTRVNQPAQKGARVRYTPVSHH